MAELRCPECRAGNSVEVQVVRSDDYWIRHYECGQCGYKWVEIDDKCDRDPSEG